MAQYYIGVDFQKEAKINRVFREAIENSIELDSKYKDCYGKDISR